MGHSRAAGDSVRQRLGKKGGAGLVSAIAPIAVGVLLAYAWNAAGASAPHAFHVARVPTPYTGVAAEQAAAHAWALITPAASVTATASTPGHPQGTGRPAAGSRVVGSQASPGCVRILVTRTRSVPVTGASAAPTITPAAPAISPMARPGSGTSGRVAAETSVSARPGREWPDAASRDGNR